MELSGHRIIEAPRADVWAALLDKDVLKDCVPGCTEMDGNPQDGFEATVVQKVGPVKATFKGAVNLTDMNEPESLHLQGEGKGGAAGFAKGGAKCVLSEEGPNQTRLDYDVEAKVGGKLAQLGSRIIDGFAKKMADQFFEDFKTRVEGGDADASPTQEAVATAEEVDGNDETKKRKWFGLRSAT
ncbi:Carbon monoxide dehydrogenase subunit G (CoxG) [Rhodobacteraceae bacterium THAF1]|uniref:CoxG family protein n=1 Tax=Palleronia sp. THAF1 TaxID=2587842 RepID=UPI000F3F8B92|nr:carbon monoxide dehydrogenase subunit G [Palleronia sp. THAF1]QFU09110.1 Carbon monoxide dehydrogenase subunit G (CoxG) [Palleronia sp. THAF1]VDC24082.1 Carbon monoxide dehydrogenase subunit G (CoxG) [Rhodobacteraceae bacterium THAF1]